MIPDGAPRGTLTLHGRVLPASNATFVGDVDGVSVVYKPVRGERPLWDFPGATLAHREVASYLVSEALGWDVVPTTWLGEGPHGAGMLQVWMESENDVSPVDVSCTLTAGPATGSDGTSGDGQARMGRSLSAARRRPQKGGQGMRG